MTSIIKYHIIHQYFINALRLQLELHDETL